MSGSRYQLCFSFILVIIYIVYVWFTISIMFQFYLGNYIYMSGSRYQLCFSLGNYIYRLCLVHDINYVSVLSW